MAFVIQSIGDVESPQTILGYWDQRLQQYEAQQPYLFRRLFSAQRWATPQIGITYGAELPARSLSPSALDARATALNQNGFQVRYFPAKYYKNMMLMDETRRQNIINALYNNPAQGVAEGIAKTQLNDVLALTRFAYFTRDQMAGQVMTKGRIDFDNGEAPIDFNWDADQHRGSTQPWGTKDAQPIEDLRRAKLSIERKNSTIIKWAVMNRNTWVKLSQSGQIINTLALNRTNTNIAFQDDVVNNVVNSTVGIMPYVYDKTDGYGNYVIPDDYVSLIPDGPLGMLAFTDTPESTNDVPGAQVATSGDGISVMTWRSEDPIATKVKVSQRILPALTNPYGVMGLRTNQASTDGSDQPSTEVNIVPNTLGYLQTGTASGDTSNLPPRQNSNSASSNAGSGAGSATSTSNGSSSTGK